MISMKRGPAIFTALLIALAALFGYQLGVGQSPTRAQTSISCGSLGTLQISGSATLSAAYVGVPYSRTLTASGGVAPYVWSLATMSGPLPSGLSLNSSGTVSGLPTSPTIAPIVLQVHDSGGLQVQTAQGPATIVVNSLKSAGAITVAPSSESIAVGMVGTQLVATVTFSDLTTCLSTSSTCPVQWASANSNFVTINTSGIPTAVAGGSVAVTASFAGQNSGPVPITVTGGTPPSTPTISATTLAMGYLTVIYPTQTLVVNGGSGGCCTFAYVGTNRPPTGITLNLSTGAITGTPSVSGTFPFTVTATDGMSNVSPQATFSIAVNSVNSPLALSLAGGATTITLSNNGTAQLQPVLCTWSNGNTQQGCPTLTYHTSDNTKASVNTNGLITAAASGTGLTNITVTGGGGTSNVVVVTVAATISISTASLAPAEINIVYPGQTLTATGGSGSGYVWSTTSGLPAGMAISSAGVISGTCTTGSAGGTTWTIGVTNGGSTTKAYTFICAPVTGIGTLTAPVSSIPQGGTVQITAPVQYSDGVTHNLIAIPGTGTGVPLSLIVSASGDGYGLGGAATASCGASVGGNHDCVGTGINVPTGSTIVLVHKSAGMMTTDTCTDTAGNTFTPKGGIVGTFAEMQESINVTGNAADIVSCVPDNAPKSNQVIEVKVFAGVVAFDASSSVNNNAASSTCTPTAMTTTNAYDILFFGCISSNSGYVFTVPAGYTGFTQGMDGASATADQIVNSIQTVIKPTMAVTGGSLGQAIFQMGLEGNATTGALAWTSGTPATATINSGNGSTQGISAGTTNIQACIGAVCSPNFVLTVTPPADTTLTIVPAGGSQTIGGQFTFLAKGTQSGVTVNATWTSSNLAVLSFVGTSNPATCNAAGTVTITASFGQISGQTTASCTTPVTGSNLLNNCNYIGSGGCSLPAGWSLVAQQDFECSNSHASPANPGCGQLPSSQDNAPGGAFTQSPVAAHTGSYGFGGRVFSDGNDDHWQINQGIVGSFTSIYISYWQWHDANALMPNTDYYLFHLVSPTNCGSLAGQDLAYSMGPVGGPPASVRYMIAIANADTNVATNCQGYYQWVTGGNLDIFAGTWRQVEILATPSTAFTLPQSNTPNVNCTTAGPSAPGCGNGAIWLWVNGKLIAHTLNADITGSSPMANSEIDVGGVVTDFCDNGNRAVPFTVCQTQAPTAFNRYYDDIIVMKQ